MERITPKSLLFKKSIWIACVLSILANIVTLRLFPKWNTDKGYQFAAARNILEKGSYSFSQAISEDISKSKETPILGWPVGYSALLAGGAFLTNDIWLAAYLLDTLTISVFLLSWLIILNIMAIPPLVGWVVFLIWTFLASPINTVYSNGLLALTLFSMGLAATLVGLKTERITLGAILGSFFMGLATWARNAYWPLILITPISFLILKRPNRLNSFIASLLPALCLLFLCISFQQSNANKTSYLSNKTKSQAVELNRLGRIYPFPIIAIGLDRAIKRWAVEFKYKIKSEYNPNSPFWFKLTCWIISSLILVICFFGWMKQKKTRLTQEQEFFLKSGLIGTSLTIGMLAFLSVYYDPERISWDSEYSWVFLQSRRYYAITIPFIVISLAFALFQYKTRALVSCISLIVLATCSIQALWQVQAIFHRISKPTQYQKFPPSIERMMRPVRQVSKSQVNTVYLEDKLHTQRFQPYFAAEGLTVSTYQEFDQYKTKRRVNVIAGMPYQKDIELLPKLKEVCSDVPRKITNYKTSQNWALYHCIAVPKATILVSEN